MTTKKIISTLIAVSVLSIGALANANNLLLDEKSRAYTLDSAIGEINSSFTTVAATETSSAKLTMKPFFADSLIEGKGILEQFNNMPYERPESYITHETSGYIVKTRGKSFATGAFVLAGVQLEVENKKNVPLIIDVNNSSIQLAQDFYGQPLHAVKFVNQGNFTQPNFIVPPKQKKSVIMYRSDAFFKSNPLSEKVMSGWYYPVKPMDLSKFRVEGNFKIDGEYVCLGLDAAIPDNMQKKYDFVKQFNAPEPKEEE